MTSRKPVLDHVKFLLEKEGFVKRTGQIFSLDLGEGYSGWLGLNRARYPNGIKIIPIVGNIKTGIK
jgi:hypothetical protein